MLPPPLFPDEHLRVLLNPQAGAPGIPTHLRDGILICDANLSILDVNAAVTLISGYSREDLIGQTPQIFRSKVHDSAFYRKMWESLVRADHWEGEIWNQRKDGSTYAAHLRISALRDDGRRTMYVGSLFDVTDRKCEQEHQRFLSEYDTLTKLPNQALLHHRLNDAMRHVDQHGGLLAACYIDINSLKAINQQHGYDGGDHVLIEVAERLRSVAGTCNLVARLGAGEFVLVSCDLGTVEAVTPYVRDLLALLNTPIPIEDEPRNAARITAHIGVALYPTGGDGMDAYGLMRCADRAMYLAKTKGAHTYCLFDPSQDKQMRQQRDMPERVQRGLERSEFTLFYQPKVDMSTGRLHSFEALARWNHPERGLRLPADFLPSIIGTEVDIEFGRWVMQHAMRQLSAWSGEDFLCCISVNISAAHLLMPDFCAELADLLRAYPDVDPRHLEIEIVESSALADMAAAVTVFDCCREMGVSIALDDFGTGYSSLAYFRRLPVDTIKIDRSFVANMHGDEGDLAIVKSVAGLAGAFRRAIIAEGVETLEQSEMLMTVGCRIGQGYGIARPMPPDAVQGWFARLCASPHGLVELFAAGGEAAAAPHARVPCPPAASAAVPSTRVASAAIPALAGPPSLASPGARQRRPTPP